MDASAPDPISNVGLSPLRGLVKLRRAKTRRFSSFDRTGGNDDRFHVAPGQTVTIAEMAGAGIVTHLWMALACASPHHMRKVVMRAFWDGESHPSIEVPVGDFFGMGHARSRNYASLPLQMSPQDGKGLNCYFAMPFATHMKFTVTNEAEDELRLYFNLDLEIHPSLEPGLGRFHARYRQETPAGIDEAGLTNEQVLLGGHNRNGEANYTILEATGHGHYVGCLFSVYSLRRSPEWDWYGEGDEMIFVDSEPGLSGPEGPRRRILSSEREEPPIPDRVESAAGANDAWPPTLHGTGTEDYFNTAWCPTEEYSAPYHGIIAAGGPNWTEPVTLYRFHIEDPVIFQKRIRVTIEHGHANRRRDSLSSVAFWYQAEPHKPFDAFPGVADRLPVFRMPGEVRQP